MTTGTNDNDIKVQYRIGKHETSRKFSTIEEVKMQNAVVLNAVLYFPVSSVDCNCRYQELYQHEAIHDKQNIIANKPDL